MGAVIKIAPVIIGAIILASVNRRSVLVYQPDPYQLWDDIVDDVNELIGERVDQSVWESRLPIASAADHEIRLMGLPMPSLADLVIQMIAFTAESDESYSC